MYLRRAVLLSLILAFTIDTQMVRAEVASASFESHCNHALANLQANRFQQAVEDYSAALLIKNDAAVQHNRGIAWFKLGKYSSALKDFSGAIKTNPAFAEAYCSRGQTYMAMANCQSANRDFAQAVKLKPDYAQAFMMLGTTNLALSQQYKKAAVENFQIATDLDPRYATAIKKICDGNATAKVSRPAAPVRTAAAATSSSPIVSSPNDQFAGIISNWLKVKQVAVKTKQADVLPNVLGGRFLARQQNSVRWLEANKKYYELDPKSVVLDQVKTITPGVKYVVSAKVREAYKLIDQRSGVVVKQVDDLNRVEYTIENAGGHWLITDAAVKASVPS